MMNFKRNILTATTGLFTILALSACFHDDAHDDEHHDETLSINLDSSQVVDANARNTDVTGTASVVFHEEEMEVTASISFTGGTPTALHIHEGFAGDTGGVLKTLTDEDEDGTWTLAADASDLTAEQAETLEAGGYYLNAHFADDTTIRGQILVHDVEIVYSDLAASSDDITTDGSGFAAITLNGNAITAHVSVADITVTAAHIHFSELDANEDEVYERIDLVANTEGDKFTVTDDLTTATREEANHGEWYVNIHTEANPAGELRADFDEISHTD